MRSILKTILKQKIKTESDKQKLAQFLGKQKGTIDKMIYDGQMGLDVWINSFMYCFNLKPETIEKLVYKWLLEVQKTEDLTEGDRLWMNLTEKLSSQEKLYYGQLLLSAHNANQTLASQKQTKKKH